MFELTEKTVKVANVNFRAEKHGEDNELAADIKVEAHVPASAIACFDDALPSFLFRAPKSGEQQSLPMEEGEQKTERRNPRLAPIKLDEDFPGYTLTLSEGMGLKKPIELAADLSKFTLEALDGGSVKVTFNASVHPDAKEAGQLAEQIQEEVTLTLKAPEAAEWQQAGVDLVDGPRGVLVTGVEFRKQPNQLIATKATLSDGRVLDLDPTAYEPKPENVIDLLKFAGVEAAELAPALLSDWPKAA